MALTPPSTFNESTRARAPAALARDDTSAQASAVSWGAVIAGAAAAAALSLILLILGVGLGLSSVSPWAASGISAATFGVSTIVWLAFTQVLAAGAGGYLAGRLRTRWAGVPADEVYFRDTAHGFLAWTVATLVTAALLTSAIASIASGGVTAGASVAGGAALAAGTAGTAGSGAMAGTQSTGQNNENGRLRYALDGLFRHDPAAPALSPANAGPGNGEPDTALPQVMRIFMHAPRAAALPADDLRYAGQLVAQRTGLAQQDAEKRVSDVYARVQTQLREAETSARDAADRARKASAYAALWLFVSLLTGAFVASLAATFGGRQRDA